MLVLGFVAQNVGSGLAVEICQEGCFWIVLKAEAL
jgi:hypothetical protein